VSLDPARGAPTRRARPRGLGRRRATGWRAGHSSNRASRPGSGQPRRSAHGCVPKSHVCPAGSRGMEDQLPAQSSERSCGWSWVADGRAPVGAGCGEVAQPSACGHRSVRPRGQDVRRHRGRERRGQLFVSRSSRSGFSPRADLAPCAEQRDSVDAGVAHRSQPASGRGRQVGGVEYAARRQRLAPAVSSSAALPDMLPLLLVADAHGRAFPDCVLLHDHAVGPGERTP